LQKNNAGAYLKKAEYDSCNLHARSLEAAEEDGGGDDCCAGEEDVVGRGDKSRVEDV
jgi:hypothetical protein